MTIQPTAERVVPVLNGNNEVSTYAKELVFKSHPYSLVIRYYAEDGESFNNNDHYATIVSDEKKGHARLILGKKELLSAVNVSGNSYNVDIVMPKNQSKNSEEDMLEAAANAQELFQKVLDERF